MRISQHNPPTGFPSITVYPLKSRWIRQDAGRCFASASDSIFSPSPQRYHIHRPIWACSPLPAGWLAWPSAEIVDDHYFLSGQGAGVNETTMWPYLCWYLVLYERRRTHGLVIYDMSVVMYLHCFRWFGFVSQNITFSSTKSLFESTFYFFFLLFFVKSQPRLLTQKKKVKCLLASNRV